MKTTVTIVGLLVAAISAGAQPVASRVSVKADRELLTTLIAAEDSRSDPGAADPRRSGLVSPNAYIRAFTVRGLGRLESPAAIPLIAPLLADATSEVRVAAADAVAQAAARAVPATTDAAARTASLAAATVARGELSSRLQTERAPEVRAALLEAIGRLNQASVDGVKATAGLIAPSLSASTVIERRGAIRGLFFLARKPAARSVGAIPTEATDRMYALLSEPPSAGYTATDRYSLAFALVGALALNDERIIALSADRDPGVRDRAIVALPRASDTATIRTVARRAMVDPAPIVRFRAVGAYAQRLRATDGCAPLVGLVRDADINVALAAVDALSGCRADSGSTVRLLDSIAGTLEANDRWHLPAHAITSLAVLDGRRARSHLPRFETSANFFVRMYADTAARLMRDTAALYRLAGDRHPNVRSSAIEGLSALVGHAADPIYIAALASDDNQLLMAASTALKGSPTPGVREAARNAWQRLVGLDRQTARDGTDALAQLYASLGGAAGDLARPRLTTIALPTFEDLAALERAEATIEMEGGRRITLRLHPFEAPTNAARFARLARAGTFDGLTFHRVAPFFVVQGPGPAANEYSAPDGPFARDELAVSNVRGTVGLSTRGRDTADGQIYINTVDNVWLDHEYTVMATITSGVDAFDRMQEGARIRKITITP